MGFNSTRHDEVDPCGEDFSRKLWLNHDLNLYHFLKHAPEFLICSWPTSWFWALEAVISKADSYLHRFCNWPQRWVWTGDWIWTKGLSGCSSWNRFNIKWRWRFSCPREWFGSKELSWILYLNINHKVWIKTAIHLGKTVVALTLFAWIAIKSKENSLI